MVEEINISKIAISKITFDETNPNILTKEQMKSLKLVMEKFGFLAPVILNKDLQVIDGEHRVRVYQELKKKTIPAYVIDVNTINKKMLRQLMNKLRGEHDKQKDADEFKLIFEAGKLNEFSELLSAQTEDFQAILEKKFDIGFEKEEVNEIPEVPKKPKSKLGDIYQLGKHRIICGDSTLDDTFNKLLNDSKATITFTSPPYNVGNSVSKYNEYDDNLLDDDYNELLNKFTDLSINFSEYVFVNLQQLAHNKISFINYLHKYRYNLVDRMIWHKTVAQPSPKNVLNQRFEDIMIFSDKKTAKNKKITTVDFGDDVPDIFKFDKQSQNAYADTHNATFPIQFPQHIIKNFTKKDDIILEPFLGVGTTLIACEQTERICYGIELDPLYIDIIIQRWENHTKKKAIKLKA